jgi:hypothetical protein
MRPVATPGTLPQRRCPDSPHRTPLPEAARSGPPQHQPVPRRAPCAHRNAQHAPTDAAPPLATPDTTPRGRAQQPAAAPASAPTGTMRPVATAVRPPQRRCLDSPHRTPLPEAARSGPPQHQPVPRQAPCAHRNAQHAPTDAAPPLATPDMTPRGRAQQPAAAPASAPTGTMRPVATAVRPPQRRCPTRHTGRRPDRPHAAAVKPQPVPRQAPRAPSRHPARSPLLGGQAPAAGP